MAEVMRYAEYKDSGVEWLGEIPSHWEVLRVKNLLMEIDDRAKADTKLPLLSVSEYYGVAQRKEKIRDDEMLTRAETLEGYKICQAGDLVSNIMLTWKSALGVSPCAGIVSPAYCVYRPYKNVVMSFFHYLFRTERYASVYKQHSTGIIDSRLRLYTDKFFSLATFEPPLHEQQAISSYLDDQCAQIDDIIASAKSSIEEYKAWKASVIYEAVTKGLDASAEMKDSGVEWIGMMPAHWKSCSLKHLCSMQAGKNLTSEQITDEGAYPVYGGNGSRGFFSEYNSSDKVLIVGRQGALCGNVHRVDGKIWATEHAVLTHNRPSVEIDFLYYLLLAMNLNQYSSSAAQPGIAVGVISTIKAVLPPSSEQKGISKYLDSICVQIDQLISEKEALIVDLESYKKSLIYEVVTGKRKVV